MTPPAIVSRADYDRLRRFLEEDRGALDELRRRRGLELLGLADLPAPFASAGSFQGLPLFVSDDVSPEVGFELVRAAAEAESKRVEAAAAVAEALARRLEPQEPPPLYSVRVSRHP